jgi:uncharacterized integral membrane protein
MTDDQSRPQTSGRGTGDLLRHLPAAILAILLIAFAIDNRNEVTVGFVFVDQEVRLVYVLLITAILGAVLGALLRHRRS